MRNVLLAIFGLLIALMLYLLNKQFPYAFTQKGSYLNALQIIFFLVVVVLGLARSNVSFECLLKWGVGWAVLIVIALTGYSYQWELKQYASRVFGQLVPSIGHINKDGSVTFNESNNGHFMIDAKVNGRVVHFLLDTGASKITLSPQDARSAGIDVDSLKYDINVDTANGVNMVGYTKLNSVQVGSIEVRDIDAYVAKNGLSGSLLGVNFLNKLSKYEVGKGSVTLWE